ncbi:MAG: DUF3093 domain-containing protein [Microbacteriaceae bacterium]
MAIYRERLTPTIGFHLALLLLLPLGFGMLAPINVTWGVINAIAVYSLGVTWLTLGAPQIVVTDTSVRAGRAHIARELLGNAAVVTRPERAAALADARAWKLIRAWIPTGVRVDVRDANDPTPYWYMSSRHPERLVAALNRD